MEQLHAVLVIGGGIAANLAIAAMFLARVFSPGKARTLGFAGTAMAVPLAAASLIALQQGREPWDVVLPLAFVAFAIVEVLVDVVLDFEVRTSRWLGPYLALFYVGQWALIGAAFRIDSVGGAIVLVTYFVCLAATAFSYKRVGHGAVPPPADTRTEVAQRP